MDCQEFNFNDFVVMNTSGYLNSTCSIQSNSNQRVSDYFTGYSKIKTVKSGSSATNCGVICEYDDINSSNYTRSTLICGETTLDPSKYYRISGLANYELNLYSKLYKCSEFTQVQKIGQKLNGIDSDDLYSDLSYMTPFVIFLIIFSFSYLVLKRVIKSSSRGDSNI